MIEVALPTSHPFEWPLYAQIAIGFITLSFILILYHYSYSRWIYQHLQDVRPEKQTEFMLKQWRRRNIRTVVGVMAAGIITTTLSFYSPTFFPARQPEPQPVAHETPAMPQQMVDPTEQVLDLFGPMPIGAEDEALESLKQRYEQSLSASFILKRCERATDKDIEALTESLQQELIRYQQEQHAQGDQSADINQLYSGIISAAEGSYELFYHRTPCDAPELDIIEQQLASFSLRYYSLNPPTEPSP